MKLDLEHLALLKLECLNINSINNLIVKVGPDWSNKQNVFYVLLYWLLWVFPMEPICIDYVGVLEEVIQRAAFVLDALGNDKHVERLCNENISSQDQQYKV